MAEGGLAAPLVGLCGRPHTRTGFLVYKKLEEKQLRAVFYSAASSAGTKVKLTKRAPPSLFRG